MRKITANVYTAISPEAYSFERCGKGKLQSLNHALIYQKQTLYFQNIVIECLLSVRHPGK